MKVAVVFYAQKQQEKLREISQALSRGISAQGHEVDVIDAKNESNKKLSFYEYIALGTEQMNFLGGKIPPGLLSYLRQAGTVSGKRCYAFVIKSGLRPLKTLTALMKQMESEGMFLKVSDIVTKPTDAQEIGKRLHIKRS